MAADQNPCALCTTMQPPPGFIVPDEGAPRIQLRCGCSFHTSCWFFQIDHTETNWVPNFELFQCPLCDESVYSTQEYEWITKRLQEPPRKTAAEVWESSEEFRKDVREILDLHKRYKEVCTTYQESVRTLRQGFLERVQMPIEAINEEFKRTCKQATHLPGRAKSTQLYNTINTKLRRLKTYGIKFTLLHSDLKGVKGAPKRDWFSYPGYSPIAMDSPKTILSRVVRNLLTAL